MSHFILGVLISLCNMAKIGYVYIMTNKYKTTLYIGVTNDLVRRVHEEYTCFDLAIDREKELKKWNRQKKENLINKQNPEWKELVSEYGLLETIKSPT